MLRNQRAADASHCHASPVALQVPRSVTSQELRAASQRVGERTGWYFGRVRAVRDEVPWDYEVVVAEAAPSAGRVLDIGTGGGELLSVLITGCSWSTVVAVDHSPRMAAVATTRLAGGATVVIGDAMALPVASGSCDLVLERHASVCATEVASALRPGGRFVTQQVGPGNTQSIFDAFGWGSNWEQFANDPLPPQRCAKLAIQFEMLGCRVDRLEEYNVGYAFLDVDSLVFFLKAVPFPEDFDPDTHLDGVNRLLATSVSHRGIETTEHRELLVVTKT